MKANLFIVFLRRPGKDDTRDDPFSEFGGFGCTGCHRKNLLNPREDHVKAGDRLAFVQGGPDGCKLLLITPPVARKNYGTNGVEIRWAKTVKPLRYYSKRAPVLAEPSAVNVALAGLGKQVNNAKRTTAEGKLASCFRTRSQPLDAASTSELMRLFDKARRTAEPRDFIQHYTDALPRVNSPLSHKERQRRYTELPAKLIASRSTGRCRPARIECRK